MSFRNFFIAGLLSCVALQSANAQDFDPRSGPVDDPAVANAIPTSADANPVLNPFVAAGSDSASTDPLYSAGPANEAIGRNPELQQVLHEAEKKTTYVGNCVGPAGPAGCVPPPLTNGAAGCCDPCLQRHRSGIFADYLFLGATGVDMPYALPVDGLGAVNVLQGRAAVADTKYDSGFRVGGIVALDDCTSIMATYWYFMSHDQDQRLLSGGGAPFLLAQLTDPGTMNVAADSLLARASYDVDFQMVDLVLRRALLRTRTTMINAVAGVRYAHLSQDLRAQYFILGDTRVNSDIDFNGIGPRIGLEGEAVSCSGFLVYGNTHANFLVGTFNADYLQSNIFSGPQSFTSIDDTRVVTQLELELGVGWQSCNGRFRITAGYYIASWLNTITNPVFIRGVQDRRLENLHDTIGFNGLTVRAMIQF
jgi:Legionella pneumophila major outer membrane protein precursor